MKILLTGATGFVGRHTLTESTSRGYEVVAIHRSCDQESCPGVRWVRSNLEDPTWNEIDDAIRGDEFVLLHLAAHGVNPRNSELEDCFRYNVLHAIDFSLEALDRGAKRIVTCGTCFEYGSAADKHEYIPASAAPEPLNAYAASKASATMALHGISSSRGITSLSLRPCVVYGEGEPDYRLWPSLRRAALAGQDFPMTAGTQIRDFIGVEKVAAELVRGVSRSDLTEGCLTIENVGSGKGQSVIDFAAEWWDKWGASGRLLPGALESRRSEAQSVVPLIANVS